jgi:lipopolysaccharide export system protein LptA
MARIGGNVRVTRGQNQLNGAEADVNMKTGITTLVAQKAGRVHGLVVPNDESSKSLGNDPLGKAGGTTARKPVPAPSIPTPSGPAPSGTPPSGQRP